MSTSAERQARIQAALPKKRSPLPWIAAALVVLLVAAGVGWGLWKRTADAEALARAAANVTVPPHANADRSGIVVNPGKAAAGAPVVAVFQDYQCPRCKDLEDMVGKSLESYAEQGKIRLEYHTMTFLDTNLGNDASSRAARAAACADVAGAYGRYHDVVYANQPAQEGAGYSDDQLTGAFAESAGIAGDKLITFKACYADQKMTNFVVGTNAAAGKAGVTGTPTIHVNGKEFSLAGHTDEADFMADLLAAGK